MKIPCICRLSALSALVLMAGCVAVPVGEQSFVKEYPDATRVLDVPPTKTHSPKPAVSPRVSGGGEVSVGLAGVVHYSQPREQHYKGVKVVKGKRVAFGFLPVYAERMYRPKNSLQPLYGWQHDGEGKYTILTSSKDVSAELMFGILWVPYSLLVAPFLPFECSTHHWGGVMAPHIDPVGGSEANMASAKCLELFPEKDRQEMGAWIWSDEKTHPQRRFASRCSHFSAFGFHKYCTYAVIGPVELEKTTPAFPETSYRDHAVRGPYAVTLFLPDIGYEETREVDSGMTAVSFPAASLLYAADGRTNVSATVRFQPPPGGLDDVRDEDDRALLDSAMGREWTVKIALPASGQRDAADGNGTPREELPLYSMGEFERLEGKRLRVRVGVEDASKTFQIDRMVRPKVRREFRERFATGEDATRRERVKWWTEDDGKTIVYTVAFIDGASIESRTYDQASRRGTIRIRVPEGESADAAKQLARENIAALLSENGGPGGGKGSYRSLGETLEDGVLTVEFEAVE